MAYTKERIEVFITGYLNMDVTVPDFMRYLTNKRPREHDLYDITTYIKELPASITYSEPLGEGAYGSVYRIDNKKEILKFISTKSTDNYDMLLEQRNNIREVLIQFILMTDNNTKNFVPIIYEIYKKTVNGVTNIVLHMEQGDKSVSSIFDDYILANPHTKLQWDILSYFLTNIVLILFVLYENYRFAHRDLHLDNMMYFGDNLKLIDFGMSALTITIDGIDYRIMNDNAYLYKLECNPKQDLGILLTHVYESYYENYLDTNGKRFIEIIFSGRPELDPKIARFNESTFASRLYKKYKNLPRPVTRTASGREVTEKLPLFHAAYNINGYLYSNTCPTTNRFTLEYIKKLIDHIDDPRTNPLPLIDADPLAPVSSMRVAPALAVRGGKHTRTGKKWRRRMTKTRRR